MKNGDSSFGVRWQAQRDTALDRILSSYSMPLISLNHPKRCRAALGTALQKRRGTLEELKCIRHFLIGLLLAVLGVIGVGQKSLNRPEGKVLETGVFHGDEVIAHSGERWLGLHVTGDNSTLLN